MTGPPRATAGRSASMDGMGEGPGFRKVRKELGVTAFGVNAVVVPPGYASGRHLHERQEELYFVHRGTVEFTFGEDTEALRPGGFARVDPATVRSMRNPSETEDAVFVCVGGAGGYVGRDGHAAGGRDEPALGARRPPGRSRSRISVRSTTSSDGAGDSSSTPRRFAMACMGRTTTK